MCLLQGNPSRSGHYGSKFQVKMVVLENGEIDNEPSSEE